MSEPNGHMPFEVDPRDLASRHVDDRLAAYTGGECSELERVAVERHLDACAACRAALDETRRIRALLAPLAAQTTPMSVADSVLARLAASTGEGSAGLYVAESSTAEVSPHSTACPVSPAGDVSLPVARPEASSSWRRREGVPERDTTAMERHTSTGTRIRVQRRHAQGNRIAGGALGSGGRLRSFATVAAVALIALGAGVFGLMSHRTTQRPGGQPLATGTAPAQTVRADLPANSTLDGISMDSPADGWAVGTVNNAPNGGGGAKNALLVHYDDHRWTTSPDSARFARGILIDVSMASRNDGWAVGSMEDASHIPTRGLLLHYAGGHWREVDISSTGFAGGGKLQMVSTDEGWLYAPVGEKSSPSHKTLVIHYHNGTWQLFSSLPGWTLVSMLSASDGWAANQETGAILRYQNGGWTQVATATGQPLTLAIVSPSEGWIAGSDANGQSLFAMRYDGQSWSQMTLPAEAHAEVDAISVAAPGDIWIFGRIDTASGRASTSTSRPSRPAPRWRLRPRAG